MLLIPFVFLLASAAVVLLLLVVYQHIPQSLFLFVVGLLIIAFAPSRWPWDDRHKESE